MHTLTLLLAGLLSLPAHSQSGGGHDFDWAHSYRDYESNRFALQMPLTEDNFSALKKHLNRYQYLLLYLPDEKLSASATPDVRIGFFSSYSDAREFRDATRYLYRQQQVISVSADEHRRVVRELGIGESGVGNQQPATKATGTDRLLVFPIDPGNKKGFQQAQQAILERGKALYLDKQYAAAARHYQLLAVLGSDDIAAWAGELAGLCYEKLGRRDLAIEQYRQMLKRYPESSGTARVSQRLRGLETAAADDPAALRSGGGRNERDFFTRGVFGQYYRSVSSSVNGGGSEETLSLLSTDWDVRSSLHWNQHDFNARISGYQLTDQLDSSNSELVMKRLLVDYRHRGTGFGAVLGRQKDSDSGVFTSFDGATVSYPLRENLRIALSTGKPVYTSDIYDGLNYYFYSLNARWDINEHWLLGGYVVSQTVNGVTDREAVGLHGRYIDQQLSGSLYIDYDTAFAELNNLLLNTHYRFSDSTDITALFGSQRSPFLTASNIFIGQADLDLNAYLKIKENRDNLLNDALARTSLNNYYSLSFNTRLDDSVRWIVDYYDSTLSDVPSSEFLLGLPDTGASPDSFHYQSLGTQLVFEDFPVANASATAGVRHASGDTSDSNQVYLYQRLRLGSAWTIVPRLTYSQINFSSSGDTQQQLRYSLNLSWRPWRNVEFDLEAGNEAISSDKSGIEFDSRYIFIGYRVNF